MAFIDLRRLKQKVKHYFLTSDVKPRDCIDTISAEDSEEHTESWAARRQGDADREPDPALENMQVPSFPQGYPEDPDFTPGFTLPSGMTFPPGFTYPTYLTGADGKPNVTSNPKVRTVSTTIRVRRTRTTPFRLSFTEDCDYLAYYCMRAYDTGKLCARTLYHVYHDFVNYCMMDYVNCMERYEVWQVVHMGACFILEPLKEFKHYPYENDYFLDDYYLVEDLV